MKIDALFPSITALREERIRVQRELDALFLRVLSEGQAPQESSVPPKPMSPDTAKEK